MTIVFILVGVLVIAGAFWFAVGRIDPSLPDATADHRPAERGGEPAFDVVVRGYRMDEVDATIADLQAEIDQLKGKTRR
jgi:uncharacterized small protein (DUF1192 family)